MFLWTRSIKFGLAVEYQKYTTEFNKVSKAKCQRMEELRHDRGENLLETRIDTGKNYSVLWFDRVFVLEWVIEALLKFSVMKKKTFAWLRVGFSGFIKYRIRSCELERIQQVFLFYLLEWGTHDAEMHSGALFDLFQFKCFQAGKTKMLLLMNKIVLT